jgi:hypothetical protein
LVDGSAINEVDLELELAEPEAVGSILRHRLAAGHIFNLDERSLHGPQPGDRPDPRITSAF